MFLLNPGQFKRYHNSTLTHWWLNCLSLFWQISKHKVAVSGPVVMRGHDGFIGKLLDVGPADWIWAGQKQTNCTVPFNISVA